MQLEEKQIPYIIEKINMRCYGDKPESFYEKTSSGLLPVMEFEGKVVFCAPSLSVFDNCGIR